MIINCPYCHTVYNLPDDKVKPEVKLRCTVCKKVFFLAEGMPADTAQDTPQNEPQAPVYTPHDASGNLAINIGSAQSKKKKGKLILAVLLFAVLAGGAVAWTQTALLDPIKEKIGVKPALTPEQMEAQRLEELKKVIGAIGFRNVRQYHLANDKIGTLLVIEGKAINESDEPRELIRLEADLYDSNRTLLVSKAQLAGTQVSYFQLQVLDQTELEQALNNKLDIISNNTNIPPGGTVPFMIVFYSPPDSATDYGIRVIDASKPAEQ